MKFIKKMDLNKNDIIQCIIIMMVFLFSCFIFSYGDCLAYTTWSVNIWDALAQGRITDYFTLTFENFRDTYPNGNPFGVLYLLPWAIWNLPIWITHYFNGNYNINTPYCLFWSQIFLVICTFIMSHYSSKIVYWFTNDKRLSKDAFIFITGAASVMISVGYFGQDEVVYLMTLMAGLYSYFINKKKAAYILLAITIIFNILMIIPVLAFIFCYEKNVIKLGLFCIISLLPEKIISLICGSSKIGSLLIQYNQENYSYLTYFDWFFYRSTVNFGIGTVSLFIVVIVCIFILAYFNTEEDGYKKALKALTYSTIIIMFAMCIFAWEHTYRYCISVPMMVCMTLIAGHRKKDVQCGMFLLLLLEVMRSILACANDYTLRFSACTLSYWSGRQTSFGTLYTLLVAYFPFLENIYFPIVSCFVAVAIMLCVYFLSYNRETIKIAFPKEVIKYVYCLIPVCILSIFMYCYLNINIDNREIASSDPISIAINGNNSIYQEYIAKGSKLDFIKIRTCTWDKYYSDDVCLSVELLDENFAVIAKEKLCANSFPNNYYVRIDFNADVKKGKLYYIHFYSDNIIEDEEQWIYLMQSRESVNQNSELYGMIEENGKIGDKMLYNVISCIAEKLN